MAAPGAGDSLDAKDGKAPVAQRIDPTREKLTPAQLQFMRQVQLAQWQKTLPQRRTRNIVTGLGIGALVLAICIRSDCSTLRRRHMGAGEEERQRVVGAFPR
ncbi:cytochrome c oxidase assembly factor 3 homolog, mitochondrial isoform X2 [Hyaena hyaena]|uniref:cytochrome c oxidase assembly factor 3 homolog, mitochondrial isoform X2 n=1 Tax=Hyaena hyaena TaxID=95912 RepID=UPI0019223BEF|nr:cytochrome c oxidase assembly factor 3 homolog, mitochondrial isoform X2 [Hyaena hyaena]